MIKLVNCKITSYLIISNNVNKAEEQIVFSFVQPLLQKCFVV